MIISFIHPRTTPTMFFTASYRNPKTQATSFAKEPTTYHFLPMLTQPPSRILFFECCFVDFSSFNLFKCAIENMDLFQYLKYDK